MKYLVIFILFFVLSCSPAKKLQRLLAKHPELVKKDTLLFTDTLVLPAIFTDTLAKLDRQKPDTILLFKDRLKIKVITKMDSIYISGHCLPDTIVRTKKVIVDKLLPCPPPKAASFWEKVKGAAAFVLIGAGAMIVLMLVLPRR